MSTVSSYDNITLITLRNIENRMNLISRIFTAVAACSINVDMITQTQAHKNTVNLSFTVDDFDLAAVISALSVFKEEGITIDILSSCSKIVFFDEAMSQTPGYGARVFSILAEHNIEALIITTSLTDISMLLEQKDIAEAMQYLNV